MFRLATTDPTPVEICYWDNLGTFEQVYPAAVTVWDAITSTGAHCDGLAIQEGREASSGSGWKWTTLFTINYCTHER